MEENNVIALRQPGDIADPLTEALRNGARALLAQAVEAEVAEALSAHTHLTTEDGRRRLVRHGHMPERTIQTGIGPVAVRQPRVRDRGGADGERIQFSSTLLPRYARRTKSLDALLPVLYLRGISSGDMQEALTALLGKDAPNLSPAVLARLKTGWQEEYERWKRRDLSARRYVYIWADGVYLQARMEPDKQCILVLIGATPEGRKELIGFQAGYRESAQSWRELLADLKARGLSVPPELAIGDGALGFWKALEEEFSPTRQQRCWVHKTMNVLNKLPKSVQPKAKADLKEIWMAESRKDAEKAFSRFLAKYEAKYDKAAACLAKDRETLLAFYDFPAEHWKHIRTGNPIESTFATVRHRTIRAKGCLSHDTGMIMVFKLIQTAQSSWRRLDGQNQLPKVITGVTFTDGVEAGHQNAAA
jgi:transposase-like protein